jgi:membrane protein
VPRYVLLVDPQTTLLAPLLVRLLVERSPSLQALWARARLEELMLADALLP